MIMNMGGVEEGGIQGKAVMDIVNMYKKSNESWGMQNMSMARYRPKVGPVSLIFQSFNGRKIERASPIADVRLRLSDVGHGESFHLAVALYLSSPAQRLV